MIKFFWDVTLCRWASSSRLRGQVVKDSSFLLELCLQEHYRENLKSCTSTNIVKVTKSNQYVISRSCLIILSEQYICEENKSSRRDECRLDENIKMGVRGTGYDYANSGGPTTLA